MPDFAHLHVHTEYSLLDGVTRINALMARVLELGMDTVAMTDHGVMFGLVKFHKESKKAGVKPVYGCEIYVAPRRMDQKEHPYDKGAYHLLLLAKNETGFKNLTRIVSLAHTKGFYYKPRADRELLSELSEGLIASSACLGGEIPKLILQENIDAAREAAVWHQKTFGEGNYYFELMDTGLAEQRKVNRALAELSQELSIPLIATNDTHYLNPEDAMVQDVMLCINQRKTLDDAARLSFMSNDTGDDEFMSSSDYDRIFDSSSEDGDRRVSFSHETSEYFVRSPQQMAELFPDHPEAISNTVELAAKCDYELELGKIYLPFFEVPDKKTADDYLRELTYRGLEERYPEVTEDIKNRADYELGVIERMGYPAYFLIVWDLIRFARSQNIPVGPGRGSVAGSLVAYALHITEICPLKYDLLFERFLNPDRVSMPDIDMDFCYERRDEVIEYARNKYGDDKVAMIITFGRLKARNAIRDVGRVLGMELATVDRVAKLVPTVIPDKKVTVASAIDYSEELKQLHDNDHEIRKLLEISQKIEGLARNVGTHAAGVVIAKNQLDTYLPVYMSPQDGTLMTQAPGEDIEDLGLLKMDFLGLRTLTVMYDAVEHIRNRTGKDISLDNLPLDDKKTFELFCSGETDGIFQFESNTAKGLMTRIQPGCLEDLIAINALNRPGPLGGGMVDTFIENRRKNGKNIDYYHDSLEPVLKETFGIMLYQEQVMRIANIIAGFTLAQSDILRRAMGKKKKAEMDKLKDLFIRQATEKTGDAKLADNLFGQILMFSGYGFNKSHSAAYGLLAYQTGYLKANYPLEYYAAMLTSVQGAAEKVAKYIDDCKRLGITVAPPDINSGETNFTPSDDRILYGLGAIKNAGTHAVDTIIDERRENGPFRSLFDLCARIDLAAVNVKTLEALIRSGALDKLEGNRREKIMALDEAVKYGRAAQSDRLSGQTQLFGFTGEEAAQSEPPLKKYEEYDTKQILEDEKNYLGLYLSHHPLDPYRDWIREQGVNCTALDLKQMDPESPRKRAKVAGIVDRARDYTTRAGDVMSIVDIEDFTGKLTVTVFPEQRKMFRNHLGEGSVVAIRGTVNVRTIETGEGAASSEIRIICRDLVPYRSAVPAAEKAKPVKRRLHFRIVASGDLEKSRRELQELRRFLSSSPGASPVIVHIDDNGNGRKYLLRKLRVLYSPELLRLGRSLFGQDNVWVETDRT